MDNEEFVKALDSVNAVLDAHYQIILKLRSRIEELEKKIEPRKDA